MSELQTGERGSVSSLSHDEQQSTGSLRYPARQDQEFRGFANIFESTGEAELATDPDAPSQEFTRRQFVALSAAALALAGATGCRRPDLQILPYSQTPENIVPGVPHFYATSMPRPGGCLPLLVESNDGRPTKIEGNPKHPASMGATDAYAQASILDLYSPDRSKEVLRKDKDGKLAPSSWEEFDSFATGHFAELAKKQGEGLAFLLEDHPSPAMRLLREHMKEKFPKAMWCVYEPINNDNVREGTRIAAGEPLDVQYRIGSARRILSLDCDFLGMEGNTVANGRAFAQSRHQDGRLYVVESTYSVTGAMAEHRLRMPGAEIVDYAIALAQKIVALRGKAAYSWLKKAFSGIRKPDLADVADHWLDEVAADLTAFENKSLVIAGSRQAPLVHALCAIINAELLHSESVSHPFESKELGRSISDLGLAIQSDKVKTLVIVGGNPIRNAPSDVGFSQSLNQVPAVIRLSSFVDETSEQVSWHLPLTHFLESWGDAETERRQYCCIQPLIAPLHNGRTALELLIQISGWNGATGSADLKTKAYKLLQASFKKNAEDWPKGDDEVKVDEVDFKRFVQSGTIDLGIVRKNGSWGEELFNKALAAYRPAAAISPTNLEITFHPSYALYDGRYAWNGWLLELPDPITKLVWDNAALVSPKTAEQLQVKTGDMLEIDTGAAKVKIPAFILPGQADNSIALHLGWGKMRLSHVAEGGGFNVYPLRTSTAMHFTTAKVTKTGETYELVTTQEHGTIPEDKDEDIIRDYSLEEYAKRHATHSEPEASATVAPSVAHASGSDKKHDHKDDPKSRFQWGYDESKYKDAGPENADVRRIALQTADDVSVPQRLDGHMQWGMVIDLNSCTGCSACMIACQAENNVPIVGKGEVKRHRQMHWISLHRYFMQKKGPASGGLEQSPADNPTIVSQPMMCQHCEAAPCESVCPVNAAVHSPEGLNLQVYNRCIGTRYCSNNCPYKVRRFNWFDFNKRRLDELRVPTPFSEAGMPETLKMQKNPEVTVRMRGVMEKCTYCIQRIEKAKIGAKVLAIKAGDDKTDTKPTDPKQEYKLGYAIRVIDGVSRIIVPDGIIKTACEQACPTQAIVFGNVRDEHSRVHKLKNAKGGPDYLVLGSLNTKPRTSYLPRLRNPNPKMEEGA